MLKGFRDFIMRGNVIELAVAVALGTAFTGIVSQFGESFIDPLIGLIGGGGLEGGKFTVNGQVFDWAAFVNAMIFFGLTAAVIYFLVVAPYNAFEERRRRGRGPIDPPPPPDDIVLLTEIRDLLRAQNQPRP
jgi:large conductance mechanosensitive channel